MDHSNVYALADYRSRRQALVVIERARSRVAGEAVTRGADREQAPAVLAEVIAFPGRAMAGTRERRR